MSDSLIAQIGLVPHAHTAIEHGIDWATDATVHHAIIAFSETECVSCEPAGALVRPISRFADAYWSHFTFEPGQQYKIVSWALANVGKKYGYLADFAIGAELVLDIDTPGWLEKLINNGSHYECAQFCDAAYVAAGKDLFPDNRAPGTVYPGSFAPIWQANGWMRKP